VLEKYNLNAIDRNLRTDLLIDHFKKNPNVLIAVKRKPEFIDSDIWRRSHAPKHINRWNVFLINDVRRDSDIVIKGMNGGWDADKFIFL
jgi:hypothetical protein